MQNVHILINLIHAFVAAIAKTAGSKMQSFHKDFGECCYRRFYSILTPIQIHAICLQACVYFEKPRPFK